MVLYCTPDALGKHRTKNPKTFLHPFSILQLLMIDLPLPFGGVTFLLPRNALLILKADRGSTCCHLVRSVGWGVEGSDVRCMYNEWRVFLLFSKLQYDSLFFTLLTPAGEIIWTRLIARHSIITQMNLANGLLCLSSEELALPFSCHCCQYQMPEPLAP